ncbi:hypothetical protein VD0002_g2898 [Verticillium dahliae]|uniref:Uncharacterized protein n=1 Tax=Verticillium dahliae TaxID=27337 RepID=A0AA44W7R5_VERDA|nr:hypothetical protein BJF96_g10287 [Verticillium dahliae]PNH37884.1 hypothetical protein VD0004_g8919 [Verticillium dahliae]PNH52712.1 hypothetical protein VD0003_g4656 [Verticillium dahliae]PNH66469.1 hypothetical protein VD0002_g2898 [Verticillium dahliae]PNH72031.1 hypothetical protein VD0001_g5520 [Verticillium dahliae]
MIADATFLLSLRMASLAAALAVLPHASDADIVGLPASVDLDTVNTHNFTASDGKTYTVWVAKGANLEDADDEPGNTGSLVRRWSW